MMERRSPSAVPAAAALLAIRVYKYFISPCLPASCGYFPTCSEYAFEAIERHGLRGGVRRAVTRLLKCHPFRVGGVDLVD
jgi:putative membrane protein insertion efficiency factor